MVENKTLGAYGVRDMSVFSLVVNSARVPDWAQFGGVG
jgi:hypothetical protein